ncbi:MAG TPA: Gfo/Idh/MocA family oxidoreductase [Candidatus Bathyarchaeia archaeon]|nr:Gfo/Idh/MocA family oxidoreductase [Candidatus Bathyarchaeia archaeon]
MPKPVEMALFGAGTRGELNLGTLAKRYPGEMRFVAVAEPDEERRERFVLDYGIPRENAFADWEDLAARPQLAAALINALPCHLHYRSTLAALEAGYDVLLEKPMAHSPGECIHLAQAAEQRGRLLMVSLQCRYNRIYSAVARLLEEGRIGPLMNIDCGENIGYWHFIMSYVRGVHSYSPTSHSFMLAKGIHDTDLITWFAGARASKVSCFGQLSFFRPENAPPGAPERCTENCPVRDSCVFDAVKQYANPGRPEIPNSLLTGMSFGALVDYLRYPRFRTLASCITRDIREPSVMKALREGPYGRCVFHAGNDVVDHETVNIEYENGVTASFSLSAFSLAWERSLNLHGAQGEIRSQDFSGRLELRTYHPASVRRKRIRYHGIIHGGGDIVLLLEFAKAVRRSQPGEVLTSARNVLEGHLIGLASEEARRSNTTVDMAAYRAQAEQDAAVLTEAH